MFRLRGVVLAALFCALMCAPACQQKPAQTETNSVPQPAPSTAQSKADVASVAKDSLKAVVNIRVFGTGGAPLGSGSGFVISKDGKVVTNYHVIEGAASAMAKFGDGAIYLVDGVTATNPKADIAILKLKTTGNEFAYLRFGDSDKIGTGDQVIAIGAPLELEGTVSNGIVSSRRAVKDLPVPLPDIEPDLSVIQITTPISHGSSGGPLLTTSGEVIGVTSYGFAQFGGENVNFAVPINSVIPFVAENAVKPFAVVPKSEANVRAAKKSPARVRTRPSPAPVVPVASPASPVATPVAPVTTSVAPAAIAPAAPVAPAVAPPSVAELNGNYTGQWQSSMFNASGAAVMAVSASGNTVRAEIALTGSNVIREVLKGDATLVGGGWSVTLKADSGDIFAKGIFKNGAFVGDYDYPPASDRGHWVVKKD